jgi:transcriptional regulator with XRE-family HTH domain
MDPKQSRMARAGLGWRAADLAEAAGIGSATVARFELGRPVDEASILKMRKAFEAAEVDLFVRSGKIGVGVPIAARSGEH